RLRRFHPTNSKARRISPGRACCTGPRRSGALAAKRILSHEKAKAETNSVQIAEQRKRRKRLRRFHPTNSKARRTAPGRACCTGPRRSGALAATRILSHEKAKAETEPTAPSQKPPRPAQDYAASTHPPTQHRPGFPPSPAC